jgi:hypothetical protein
MAARETVECGFSAPIEGEPRSDSHWATTPKPDRTAARCGIFAILGLASSLAGCSRAAPAANAISGIVVSRAEQDLDEDGVRRLLPSAPGASFHLGAGEPNDLPDFAIEKEGRATRRREGSIAYWNTEAYALDYASGGEGKTIRLHIQASGGQQEFTWKTQHGFLSNARDLKNLEFTAYVRVHGIFDLRRAAVTLKIRGGRHTQADPDLASCTMITFAPHASPAASRFGKELSHPIYDYVRLEPLFPASLEEDRWVGLKLVSYAVRSDARRVVNRLYVDDAPFDDRGRPANHFRLFSEYIDVEGRSTGHYSKLADWGGWQTTLRTDGISELDFAIISVREIIAPAQ